MPDDLILYHGTSETNAHKVLASGLLPRSRHHGPANWQHVFTGHREVVYLTSAYPIIYALEAAQNGERLAIIEVNAGSLAVEKFVPDEDLLAQALRKVDDLPAHWDAKQRCVHYRSRLRDYADNWKVSLQRLGTCGYYGSIPVTAIRRLVLIDPTQAIQPVWLASDATVNLGNYRVLGGFHRALTRWFFGDPPLDDLTDLERFLSHDHIAKLAGIERTGIEIIR